MTPRELGIDVLLGAAVLVVALSALGLVLMRDAYQRLHFIGPAGVVAPLCVAGAVLIREGVSQQSVKAGLVAAAMLVTSPVLAHATARAARVHDRGDWRPPR